LPAADEAFARSGELWRAGSSNGPELLDEGRLLDLEASLRRAQRRLPEALALLDRALAVGKKQSKARILIKKAKTLEEMGDYEGALSALRRADPLVGGAEDPRLVLCVRFNLLETLCLTGRFAEAEPLLPVVRELAVRLGNELDLVRLRWLEARLAAGFGRTEESLEALRWVRSEFAARGIAYDTALVTLELAALLAEEGRTREVKDLARHTAPLFQAQGVHREALAALTVFRSAAEQETLTAEAVREILAFLQAARLNPTLRFVPGAEQRSREGSVDRPSRPRRVT
jgi:tetratricopeptide (TPR) repeat protein